MADRKLVYRVELNASQAKAEAKQFAAQIKSELSNIKITALDNRIFAGASAQIAKIRTELQSLATVQPPKIEVDSNGIRQAAEQTDNLERQLREAEAQARRTSAAVQQTQAAQRAPAGGGAGGGGFNLGGVGGQLLGLAGISLTVAGIASLGQELATLRKESLLATTAFNQLSGGAGQATARLAAMKTAAGGTLATMEALRSANQITALRMADTAEGFGRITQAARAVTFVSPVIHDIGSAISELALASANLSFRRLDQLGLSVTEVKAAMDELQAANSGLSDNQAFLGASVSTLIEKFGGLTSSAAAQATGVDKLRVAWEEFKKTLAEGGLGQAADDAQADIAGFINTASVRAGNKQADTIISALKHQLSNAGNFSVLSGTPILGDAIVTNAEGLRKAVDLLEKAKTVLASGAPGAQDFSAAVANLTSSFANQLGPITEEQIAQLATLENRWNSGTFAVANYAEGLRAGAEAQRAANEATAAANAEALTEAKKALSEAVGKKVTDVAGAIGFDQAREVVRQKLEDIKRLISQFEEQGLTGLELDIAVSLAAENLDADIQAIIDNSTAQMERLLAGGISATVGRGIAELNSGVVDASPALTDVRERMIELQSEMALTNSATEEQAQEFQYLLSVADAVGSSTSVFAALQDEAGQALLTSNSYASGLASNIAILDAAQATGAISAGQHAGALYSLVTALIAAAEQAGITGAALAQLKAIQAGIDTTLPGFVRGQTFGDATVASQKAQEDARIRAENRRAAEQAAREQEQAAKRAARELEQGAKKAARELEGALQNVPGLFGTSKVTQGQLDLAKLGVPQNFADDFVRHFRDLVENGTPWEDATPEKVKQALQNVGINPVDDLKGLMAQLEEAWNNQSLFANVDNISLINAEAVQQGLDLQEKMKQGRQNIMEAFGVAIDDATGAVSAGAADTTADEGLKTAVTDGKKQIIDHLTSATQTAVDAATGSVVTGANGGTTTGTGAAQLSSLTITQGALDGLFATIKPPPLIIDSVEVGPNLIQSAVTAITTQIQGEAADLLSLGKSLSAIIETGFTQYWAEAQASTTLSGEFRTAFGTQVQAGRDSFVLQGRALAGLIDSGFSAYWEDAKSQTGISNAILAASATQLTNAATNIKAQGDGIASLIMIGFGAKFTLAQEETGMATAIRTAFGTQVQASRDAFTGQGGALAGIIEQGFIGHWATTGIGGGQTGGGSQMASAVLDQLTAQLVGSADRIDAIGNGIAGLVMLGMDFAGAGGTLITQLESDLVTDVAVERLGNVGHSVADALFNGFSSQVAQADWVGAIVAAVIAQLNAGVQANG